MSQIRIRKVVESDCTQLLELMLKLAEFEGYHESFKVTENDLLDGGFKDEPNFFAFVAETKARLIGMLVYHYQPFTYDLKPWMLVKELYVNENYRGCGVGKSLIQAASIEGLSVGASRMKWEVLSDNLPAKEFYLKLGAEHEDRWRTMSLTADKMKKLI